MNNLSMVIVEEMKKKLPSDALLIDFFTEILPMKKEAAYRRLRGEIPLSLSEAHQIASRLNISLDKLLQVKRSDTYSYSIVRMGEHNFEAAYCKTLEQIIGFVKLIKCDPSSKIYSAINLLPESHLYKYPTISRFRIFRWVHQCRNTITPPKLSEVEITPRVRQLELEYLAENQQIARHYVWIRELFGPLINDIHYFRQMGLVSEEEGKLLTEEMHLLLDDLEADVSAGETSYGAPFTVYLADTYFDSNYFYTVGNGYQASSTHIFGVNFLSSTDEEVSNDVKMWIESLTRYATLISSCGEIDRSDFFNLQRKIVDTVNLNSMYEIYL